MGSVAELFWEVLSSNLNFLIGILKIEFFKYYDHKRFENYTVRTFV